MAEVAHVEYVGGPRDGSHEMIHLVNNRPPETIVSKVIDREATAAVGEVVTAVLRYVVRDPDERPIRYYYEAL